MSETPNPLPPAKTKRPRGRPRIKDEFSHLPISRQFRWQLRQRAKGLCRICGEPAISRGHHCLNHIIKNREDSAKRHGYKKQKARCLSRELEKTQSENPPEKLIGTQNPVSETP